MLGADTRCLESKMKRKHSTVVMDGSVYDKPEWILGGKMPSKYLWYQSPKGKQLGFFTEICKVYEISNVSAFVVKDN